MSGSQPTPEQVTAAGLGDWRQVENVLQARFRTGDFVTGLEFVNRIGAVAEAHQHHPDLTLTYPEVRISLCSHDVGGVTDRDLSLAREISTIAAAMDVPSATADEGSTSGG